MAKDTKSVHGKSAQGHDGSILSGGVPAENQLERHITTRAEELLQAIVDSAVSYDDACSICREDVSGERRHSEGCIILLAERFLIGISAESGAQPDRKQVREIVNNYEDRHKHLRGYYTRTDLLSIAREAAQHAPRPQPDFGAIILEITNKCQQLVQGEIWTDMLKASAILRRKWSELPPGFWEYLEHNLEEVRKWPGWMRGEAEHAPLSQPIDWAERIVNELRRMPDERQITNMIQEYDERALSARSR